MSALLIIEATFAVPVTLDLHDTISDIIYRYREDWARHVTEVLEPWTEPADSSRVDVERIEAITEVHVLMPWIRR